VKPQILIGLFALAGLNSLRLIVTIGRKQNRWFVGPPRYSNKGKIRAAGRIITVAPARSLRKKRGRWPTRRPLGQATAIRRGAEEPS